MGNIMKEIIMRPALFLVLLALIMSETNRHQCDATAIPVDNSTTLPPPSNGSSPIIGNGNNSESTSADGDHHIPVSAVDVHPPKVDNNNGSGLPNMSNANGTEVIKVTLDEEHSTTEHTKPCPVPDPNLLRKDHHHHEHEHKTSNVGNQGNGNDKEEKHETALEQIGDSLANVAKTIKNSFTSIFSPGAGLPAGRTEEVDCHRNETAVEGNSTSIASNVTSLPEQGKDQDHPQKLEEDGGAALLIHPVSNNDTITGSVNNTETNSTITSTTTVLPVSEKTEVSTAAPAPVVP